MVNSKELKVIAIVVTYNRKELLKECIEALMNQTYDNCDILIVDNASTDGTEEYISKYVDNKKVFYKNIGQNIGGAGGFNYGMKEAYKMGCDFMWLMDDDCIVTSDALTELIASDGILEGEYGFLSSIVLWKDKKICQMNKQKIKSPWFEKAELLRYGLLRTYHATFVSFFIKTTVVEEVGLPIKEFFIWGDDVEYTGRIAKNMECYIVGKSIVEHKTKNNEGSNIAKDELARLNRYKYAYRNEVYIARRNGLKGRLRQFAKIILHIFRVIFKNSNGHRLKKIGIIIGNSFNGALFSPKVEYLEKGANDGKTN